MVDLSKHLTGNKTNAIIVSVYIAGEEIDITGGLKKLTIIKHTFKPIYLLRASINNELLKKLEFEKSVKFRIKIYSSTDSIRNPEMNNLGSSTNLKLQTTLLLTPFSNINLYYDITNKINNDFNSNDTTAMLDDSSEIQLELFEYKNMDTDSVYINRTYKNVKLIDVISDITKKLDYNKYIISKFDNQTTYKEIFINNMKIVEAIKYLDSTYGFYTTGLRTFLDNDTFLMYKMNRPLHTNSEYTSAKNHTINLFMDRNNRFKNSELDTFKSNFGSKTKAANIVVDTDINIYNNTYQVLKLNGTSFTTNDETETKYRNVSSINILDNPYITDKLLLKEITPKNSVINNNNVLNRFYLKNYVQTKILNELVKLHITVDNVPYNDIPIFSLFNVNFSSTKNNIYNGTYGLQSMSTVYTVTDRNDISCKAELSLYRIQEVV